MAFVKVKGHVTSLCSQSIVIQREELTVNSLYKYSRLVRILVNRNLPLKKANKLLIHLHRPSYAVVARLASKGWQQA